MATEGFRPTRAAIGLLDEFKAFALKGSVIDLAVGVIIGGAFGRIVTSLVENLIMPLVGIILPGEKGYQKWTVVVRGQTIPYGLFLADVVNFLIVALALFLFIKKFLGWIMRFRQQQEAETPPSLTKDQELLVEIRDLLRSRPG